MEREPFPLRSLIITRASGTRRCGHRRQASGTGSAENVPAMVRELRESRGTMVPSRDRKKEKRPSLKEIATRAVAKAECEAIRLALLATQGNTSEAARLLRVDDKTLHIKIMRYDIETGPSDVRSESNIVPESRASSSCDHVRPRSLIN